MLSGISRVLKIAFVIYKDNHLFIKHHTVATVIRTGYGWQTSKTVGYRCLTMRFCSPLLARVPSLLIFCRSFYRSPRFWWCNISPTCSFAYNWTNSHPVMTTIRKKIVYIFGIKTDIMCCQWDF